jgi:VHS domain
MSLINSPKLAVQAIGKRLMNLRNLKVQLLTLELIDFLSYTCDTPLYTQISTNDFLQRFNTILAPSMNQ